MVWLAQEPDDELRALAEQAAASIGLPLTVVETGDQGLERRPRPTSSSAALAAQSVQEVGAPGLGLGDLVEREDVQALDEGTGLAERGGALLEEASRR